MLIRILVKHRLHLAQQIRQIESHTVPDVSRKRFLEKRVVILLGGVDVAMRTMSAGLVRVDKSGLDSEADGVPRSTMADADIPQHEVKRQVEFPETQLVEDPPGALLADCVRKGAELMQRVVSDARMLRHRLAWVDLLLKDRDGVALRHRGIVSVHDAPAPELFRQFSKTIVAEADVGGHGAAMADPENVPVVPIRRPFRRHSPRESVKIKVRRLAIVRGGVFKRWVRVGE